jgi:excisionase family DNA binding protein
MSYVTTEKAARLLMVSKGTILKWVEQRRLQARKTVDQQRYLILRDSVHELLISSSGLIEEVVNGTRPAVPCWEYNAENGRIRGECLSCPAFRSSEKKCYQVGKLLKESGQGATCCITDCEDCSYYKYQKQRSESQLLSTTREALNSNKVRIEYETSSDSVSDL